MKNTKRMKHEHSNLGLVSLTFLVGLNRHATALSNAQLLVALQVNSPGGSSSFGHGKSFAYQNDVRVNSTSNV